MENSVFTLYLSAAWDVFHQLFPFVIAACITAYLINRLVVKNLNKEDTTKTFWMLVAALFLAYITPYAMT